MKHAVNACLRKTHNLVARNASWQHPNTSCHHGLALNDNALYDNALNDNVRQAQAFANSFGFQLSLQ